MEKFNIEHFDYQDINVHYQKCVCDSGLTVIYYEKKGFNQFICDAAVNYGARANAIIVDNKRYEITKGLAHYLEHKMFTLQDGSDAAIGFDHLSLNNNAMTSYNATQYYCGGVRHFKEGLTYLLKMVLNEPLLTQATYEKELPIISEEIDMYRNIPEAELETGINKRLFHDYYFSEDVAGTRETIRKITPEELKFVHKTMYVPQNMVLIIVGDLDRCYGYSFTELLKYVNELTLPYGISNFNVRLDYGYNPHDKGQGPKVERMSVGLDYAAIGFKKDIASLSTQDRDILFENLNVILEYYFGENRPFMDALRQKGVIYNGDFSIDVSDKFLVVTLKAMGYHMDIFEQKATNLLNNIIYHDLTLEEVNSTIKELIGSRVTDLEDDEEIIDILIDDTFDNANGFKDYLYLKHIDEKTLNSIKNTYFKDVELEYFRITNKE